MPMNARRGFGCKPCRRFRSPPTPRAGTVTALVFSPTNSVRRLAQRPTAHRCVGGRAARPANPRHAAVHPSEVLTVPASPSATQEPGHGQRFDADSIDDALRRVCRPRPVYHANSRISSEHIHDSIVTVLRALAAGDDDNAEPSAAQSGKAAQSTQSGSRGTTSTTATSPEPAELKSPHHHHPAPLASPVPDSIETSPKIPTAALRRAIPDILPESVRSMRPDA